MATENDKGAASNLPEEDLSLELSNSSDMGEDLDEKYKRKLLQKINNPVGSHKKTIVSTIIFVYCIHT